MNEIVDLSKLGGNKKVFIFCPHCATRVIPQKLKPHHKKQSQLIASKAKLCCYQYDCPRCGKKSSFNKEYVTEEWKRLHPDLLTAQEL